MNSAENDRNTAELDVSKYENNYQTELPNVSGSEDELYEYYYGPKGKVTIAKYVYNKYKEFCDKCHYEIVTVYMYRQMIDSKVHPEKYMRSSGSSTRVSSGGEEHSGVGRNI